MEKRIELECRGRPAAQVTELNLDNCRSTNIVGLTEEYSNLTKLSLINVGLTSLKGFPKLPKLKKLELSDNRISNGLACLAEACPSITNLNLSGNRLKDLEALKPLEKFTQLEVLDLFNNEATSVDNYREKLFAMIPSLKYLDGFDPKDTEAPSEGEDDEDANGFNGSDDDGEEEEARGRFHVNGLEIDLDELEAFERQVAQKKSKSNQLSGDEAPPEKEEAPDYLDEYLERLQIQEKAEAPRDVPPATDPQIRHPQVTFLRLLLMFMSLVSMAKLLGYYTDNAGGGEEESDDGEGEGSDVSLSEVLNEELADDSSDWDEDGASDDGEEEEEDDEEDEDEDEADVSTGKTKKKEDDDGNEDEGEDEGGDETRGKKRKHDD